MSNVPPEAFAELQAVYADLEAELEPLRRQCATRGLCCDFAALGHMLYVTTLEAAYMARAGVVPHEAQMGEGKCPFLRGNLCGLRTHRALGCRVYYCDRTYEEERNALCEKMLKRVRDIETRFGLEHSYQAVTRTNFREFE